MHSDDLVDDALSDASNCSIFSEVITHDVAKLRRDGRLNVVAGIRRQDLLEALRQRSRVYLEVSQFNCQCGHGDGGCKVEPYSSHYRLIQLGFIFGVQTKHMYLVSFLKCAMFHLTALNSNIGFKNRHYLVHRVWMQHKRNLSEHTNKKRWVESMFRGPWISGVDKTGSSLAVVRASTSLKPPFTLKRKSVDSVPEIIIKYSYILTITDQTTIVVNCLN